MFIGVWFLCTIYDDIYENLRQYLYTYIRVRVYVRMCYRGVQKVGCWCFVIFRRLGFIFVVIVFFGLFGFSFDFRVGIKWMYREFLVLFLYVYQCLGGKCGYRFCNRSSLIIKSRVFRYKFVVYDSFFRFLVYFRSSFFCYG